MADERAPRDIVVHVDEVVVLVAERHQQFGDVVGIEGRGLGWKSGNKTTLKNGE